MDREFLENLNILPEAVEVILEQWASAEQSHAQELAEVRFEYALNAAIHEKKGRNAAAIRALLDIPALKDSENPEEAIRAALDALKGECGYLFEPELRSVYAPGSGIGGIRREYTGEEIGRMSMAEYKAYRNGGM